MHRVSYYFLLYNTRLIWQITSLKSAYREYFIIILITTAYVCRGSELRVLGFGAGSRPAVAIATTLASQISTAYAQFRLQRILKTVIEKFRTVLLSWLSLYINLLNGDKRNGVKARCGFKIFLLLCLQIRCRIKDLILFIIMKGNENANMKVVKNILSVMFLFTLAKVLYTFQNIEKLENVLILQYLLVRTVRFQREFYNNIIRVRPIAKLSTPNRKHLFYTRQS